MLSDLLKYHHVEIDASKTLSSLTGFSVPIHLGYQEMFLKIANFKCFVCTNLVKNSFIGSLILIFIRITIMNWLVITQFKIHGSKLHVDSKNSLDVSHAGYIIIVILY